MSPCSPLDISISVPSGPSGPALPGFGIPFSLKLPNLNPLPDNFPEDLLGLLEKLQLLVPPGALKGPLNPNFGKDVFDAIMKMLDQFMPFLMLYKFFLPILELILCIIEVLCALMNPFKLIKALTRLFTICIPAVLNLFPIFAIICMIISLLLLLLALIEYIILQIIKFIKMILKNILALKKAIEKGDANAIKSIAHKLGSILCIFQNLFVLFAIFNIIIKIFKDLLSLAFRLPPCDDGESDDDDGCCTPDVCPEIVKNKYTRSTGTFKYFETVNVTTTIPGVNIDVRKESWQFFDLQQTQAQQFRNIFDAHDVTVSPKPIFFPTDSVYTAQTAIKQAPYVIDLKMFYSPSHWGRNGPARYIQFKNCIVTNVPTTKLINGDLTTSLSLKKSDIPNGVVTLAGGLGFEDDGYTKLKGFSDDGTSEIGDQATIENFFHKKIREETPPIPPTIPPTKFLVKKLSPTDGYTFNNVTYTFKPNMSPLLNKNIITLGCVPELSIAKKLAEELYVGDMRLKSVLVSKVLNNNFPDPQEAQECLQTAITAFRTNINEASAAELEATCNICLNKLKNDTKNALKDLIGIGVDSSKSTFTLTPKIQFTTKPIIVTVDLYETNGLSITKGIPEDIANDIAARIKSQITFGKISHFKYDGNQSFIAELTSDEPGNGTNMISFDNNILSKNTLPKDSTEVPTRSLQSIDYQFIYAPVSGAVVPTGEGDTDGTQVRRDNDIGSE